MLSASQGHSFEACTDTFIEWLSRRHGTSISPKIRLVDLREHQQGRGVGNARSVSFIILVLI